MDRGNPRNFEMSLVSSHREAVRLEQQEIRIEKRQMLLEDRRLSSEEMYNVLFYAGDAILDHAEKLASLTADVASLKELRKVLHVKCNADLVMSVEGVVPALVQLLTGSDADKQLEAVSIIVNLTCGSHQTTYKIAEFIGVYLVTFIQSSSHIFQDYCILAARNIVSDCEECFNLLKAQGLLPALIDVIVPLRPEVILSTTYALRACTKYKNALSELMKLDLPLKITKILAAPELSREVLKNTAYILSHICPLIALQGLCEVSVTIAHTVLHHLHEVLKEDVIDLPIATSLIRCLGLLSYQCYDLCEVLCRDSKLNMCIAAIMCSEPHHLKTELLWALTNMTASLQSSSYFFDVNPILDGIHIFLSPLEEGVLLAFHFLCALVKVKPEMKEAVRNKGVLTYIDALLSYENHDVLRAANALYALMRQ